jgi:anti-sigma B factor antagonist
MSTPSPWPTSPDDDTYTVSLTGEIDMDRKPELRNIVMGYRRSTAANALVDLSAVTFMDSAGIATIVSLHKTATSRGGRVYLLQPPDILTRVLHLTGLLPLFQILDRDPS